MDSLLSVADGPVEPEDYYLDLDAGADAGVEDFDFKLDGAYGDETQGISVEADPGSAAKTTADFEIGYEDEEAAAPTEGATKAAEAEHDAKQDLDAEYQDEIDYEDDEPETNAAVADSEVTGPGSPGAGQEAVVHEHDEAQVLDHPIMNDGFDEPDGEDMGPFDVGADASADATDDASAHRSQPDHNQTPASGLGDLRDTSADVSSASLASSMPEITVHYNHGRYSLVGAPSDDPDSYFFSDSKDLDGSLSQLLSSIRAVISDEVSPGDELVVRIDGLDLEFGEKSNPKFLNRTFQEIVSCFSALFNDSENEAQELELDLLLRRDCEMRFVELLEEAGLADEPSDISTGFGGVDDDGLANEDVSVDDYPQEFDIGEGLVNAIADGDPSEAAEQDQKAMTSQADSNNGEETLSGALDLQTNLNEIDSAELTQFEPGNEMNFEEEYLEVHSEVTNGEVNEETNEEKGEACALADVDDAGDLDEVFKADEDFDGPELAIDITEQPIIGQGVDAWSGGQAEMDTGEVGDTGMPEPTLHDNDASLNFDTGSALPTILEQETAEHIDLTPGDHPAGPGPSIGDSVLGEGAVVDAQEFKSRHTSRTSTINGDEMGHDEHNQTGYLASNQGSEQQPEPPGDEIDWENDGEEDGEQVAAPTPSGKRSRTNEIEGLPDGTDNKRRRT